MKKLDNLAKDMIYGDILHRIAEERNIGLIEARVILGEMSFKEYRLAEQTVPAPSGQTIVPTGSSTTPPNENDAANQAAAGGATAGAPTYIKGQIPKEGQSVSVRSRAGLPIQGTIKRVDQMKNGAIVLNPETQKEEWMNINTLEPFMVSGAPAKPPALGQPGNQTDAQGALAQSGRVAEDAELDRLLELAGIQENCSGGATGAGAIAMSAAPMGKMRKREYPEESLNTEYTPKKPAETIIGDTKPNQASGKLSADLAASGKKAASRINNGRKRVR